MATKKIKGSLSIEDTLNVTTSISVGGSDISTIYAPIATDGYAPLDAQGKISASALPASVMEYQGTWNASTNSPALSDGGAFSAGDVYIVDTAGSQDLGSGSISFSIGDWALYNGSTWEKVINSTVSVSAGSVSYSNTTSGLSASTVQAAIDEVEGRLDTAESNATGSVTVHSDVSDAGSGAIITTVERSKLSGIEPLADVTDSTNVISALDGAAITSATVAGTDKVLIQDADDSSNLKTVTAQSIADLASGSVDFSDDVFRVSDNLDSSKKIAFQASGLTTSTVRTVTMPDADVDLGLVNSAIQPSDNISSLTNDSNFVDAAGVRSTVLTGLSLADATDVVATDTVLEAFGKVQRQLDDISAGAGSSLDGLSDVTLDGTDGIGGSQTNDILVYNGAVYKDMNLGGGTGITLNASGAAGLEQIGFDLDISGVSALSGVLAATGDTVAVYDLDGVGMFQATVRQITGRSPGDFAELEDYIAAASNLPITAVDLSGCSFSPSVVRSFECQIVFEAATGVGTTGKAEVYKITGLNKSVAGSATGWDIFVESVGDNCNITFTITAAGQVQYAFPNDGTSNGLDGQTYLQDTGTFRFKANTISMTSAYEGP
jgi:hypothetical protein